MEEAAVELPPLVRCMAIEGLPPKRQSEYAVTAEEHLMRNAKRWPHITSLEHFYRLSISFTSFLYSGVVGSDRLEVIAAAYAVFIILNELLFDAPDDSMAKEYGIDGSICRSPHKMEVFVTNLKAILQQEQPPVDPCTPIEEMMWEVGRDIRCLSTPEWFQAFLEAVTEHHTMCITSHLNMAGDRFFGSEDLDSYTKMRYGNFAGGAILLLVELAKDALLPEEVREDARIRELSAAAGIHAAFVNDIFSYPKEVAQEENPRNLVKILMDCEGIPLPQAAWRAVNLVNSYANVVMDMESQLPEPWDSEPWGSHVRRYVEGVKDIMSGNMYWMSLHKRYRHPDSVFPELRAVTNAHAQLQEI